VNPVSGPASPSALGIWVSACRPRTLSAAVAPVVVGSALAAHDHRFDPLAAGICLAFALLVQVGTNFSNDYYDFIHGADTAVRVGPRRAVASGLVRPAVMRRAAAGAFGLAFVVGLSLIHWGGYVMLAVGLASILFGYAYTGGPWPLGYRGWGDILVFVFFGLVAVTVTYFVQAAHVTRYALLAGVPLGLLAANILLVNNYRDAETDAAAGKQTLVVRLGRSFARVQHAASLAVAFAIPLVFYFAGFGPWSLLPLLAAPIAFSHVRRLAQGQGPGDYIALLGGAGKLIGLYAVLFAAGLVLGR
jgi:1,4-dihydroxy-2-naphthoate octaprenyltransferase